MKMKTTTNICKKIRNRLYNAISKHIGPDADWVQNHIAVCPRCQQRVASLGRVHLAISFIKSQPHSLDLLMRANTQAVTVLKHSLRDTPEAQKLKKELPEQNLFEKCAKYKSPVANAAACIAIVCLMKIGIFSSMQRFQTQSKQAVRNYYAANAGQDIADEIFTT